MRYYQSIFTQLVFIAAALVFLFFGLFAIVLFGGRSTEMLVIGIVISFMALLWLYVLFFRSVRSIDISPGSISIEHIIGSRGITGISKLEAVESFRSKPPHGSTSPGIASIEISFPGGAERLTPFHFNNYIEMLHELETATGLQIKNRGALEK